MSHIEYTIGYTNDEITLNIELKQYGQKASIFITENTDNPDEYTSKILADLSLDDVEQICKNVLNLIQDIKKKNYGPLAETPGEDPHGKPA